MNGNILIQGSTPLFLFSTAEKSQDFEIFSRSIRKYHGDFPAFADELKAKPTTPMLAMETLGLVERIEREPIEIDFERLRLPE